jgi:hypothetical protein
MGYCSEGSQGETLSAVDLMKEEQEEEDVCMYVCMCVTLVIEHGKRMR